MMFYLCLTDVYPCYYCVHQQKKEKLIQINICKNIGYHIFIKWHIVTDKRNKKSTFCLGDIITIL